MTQETAPVTTEQTAAPTTEEANTEAVDLTTLTPEDFQKLLDKAGQQAVLANKIKEEKERKIQEELAETEKLQKQLEEAKTVKEKQEALDSALKKFEADKEAVKQDKIRAHLIASGHGDIPGFITFKDKEQADELVAWLQGKDKNTEEIAPNTNIYKPPVVPNGSLTPAKIDAAEELKKRSKEGLRSVFRRP
jgi:hypothetical protein